MGDRAWSHCGGDAILRVAGVTDHDLCLGEYGSDADFFCAGIGVIVQQAALGVPTPQYNWLS
ncbi:MAG: hypothetical protein OWR62_16430 [Sulfobacillus thermotolerans]|nr:hypothetical protein [Sulfobacillus thermotolerans]